MLTKIREHASSYLIKIVLGAVVVAFIGTIFLVWGMGNQTSQTNPPLATVEEEVISSQEYWNTYDQTLRTLEQFRASISPADYDRLAEELKKTTLDNLIRNRILIHEAGEMGLDISPAEVRSYFEAQTQFQTGGRFDPRLLSAYLEFSNLTLAELEAQVSNDLLARKTATAIKTAAVITDRDIEEEYRRRNQEVTVSYAKFDPPKFVAKTTVSKDEIADYFDRHREDFRKPATFRFRYLKFDPSRFVGDLKVTDDEAAVYYAKNQDRYTTPEIAKVRHILFTIDPDGGEDARGKTIKNAEEVLDKIRGGADFGATAKEFSQDAASREKGGDLGFISMGQMIPEFEETAFNLEPGEVSEPVESRFGIHLIKVDEKIPERTLPFEEVRQEVIKEILYAKARDMAFSQADEALSLLLEGENIEEVAGQYGIVPEKTEPVTIDSSLPSLGLPADEVRELTFLTSNEYSEILETESGSFLFTPLDKNPDHIPPLEEVEPLIRETLAAQKSVEAAEREADRLFAALKEGHLLSETAAQFGAEVIDAGPFSRLDSPPPGVAAPDQFIDRAFSIPQVGKAASPLITDQAVYVIVLTDRRDPDPDGLATDREGIVASLISSREEEILSGWLDEMRTRLDINILSPEIGL